MNLTFTPVLAGAVLALLVTGCDQAKLPAPPAEKPVTTNATMEVLKLKADFSKLIGRWERPDGGYVLEIKSVDAQGKLDAKYLNPNPINVEQALATAEADAIKVFVMLRDENYPGCTYKLTYDAKADQLFGKYFQAAMGETYDVTFGRLQE